MTVYVAAPWTHKADAKTYADALEAGGHTITKKWWEHREVPGYLTSTITPGNRIELETQAAEDIGGVLTAEAFVLLNFEKSEGKAVETGIALLSALLRASGTLSADPQIFVIVGGQSNLFHYVDVWKTADSPADVLAILA